MNLAGNASTQSRGRRPLPPGAVSARTLDVDGVMEEVVFSYPDKTIMRRLLSWVGGQSGLLWGGGPYPLEIRDAIKYEMHQAQGSYGHDAEWALADALGAALDGVFTSDKLSCRFFQDGGTALAAAARVARHATGLVRLASVGYHGAAEEWSHRPSDMGIPGSVIENHQHIEWGQLPTVAAGALCVEVPPVSDAEARRVLAEYRQYCDIVGAIFILDEVVTGFRLGLQGAAGYYGVKPDIACYGKAMSATGCVSAIVGRADLVGLLGEPVFLSTTFGGSPGPCAVAAATVKWLTENKAEVYGQGVIIKEPGHLWNIGQQLKDGFNALGVKTVGQPERSVCVFPSDAEWLAWCGQMIERGVMVHRPNFPTLNHAVADVTRTLEAAAEVAKEKQHA